jgi:hypothetical protein
VREHTVAPEHQPTSVTAATADAVGEERWSQRDLDYLGALIASRIRGGRTRRGTPRPPVVARAHKPLTVEQVADPSSDTEHDAPLASAAAELHSHLAGLDDLRREIVCRNFGIQRPQQGIRQIAADLGVSRMTAHRLYGAGVPRPHPLKHMSAGLR